MVNGILGKKIGMTQLFDERGEVHPVTVLQAGPCVITQLKRATKDGYEAAQIGLVEFVKNKNVTEPMKGHFAKHNLPPVKFIREVAVEEAPAGEAPKEAEAGAEVESSNGNNGVKVGDKVLVDIFNSEKRARLCRRRPAASFRRRSSGPRTYVPGARFDWRIVIPVARFSGNAYVGAHGRGPGNSPQSQDSRHRY